jgi:hypothetical protein
MADQAIPAREIYVGVPATWPTAQG